jgi:histone acetyltransferase (RNA polymerase elongator complex component)
MKKSPKRIIVPIFLPQAGCSHYCIFCNQTSLTGFEEVPSPEDSATILAEHLSAETAGATIAFYGGSFTALDQELQAAYLDVASRFVDSGMASGIRLSTRPDAVDGRLAQTLADRHVREVELGVQSMDDEVLRASCRGHTASDVELAVAALKSAGISVGVQMMAGLPGDTRNGFINSIKSVIALGPDFARVFPTVVVEGAPLARLWKQGQYEPPVLDEAVSICADALELFTESGTPVIKLGLQPTKWLDENRLAGAYHPAFGHMVESEIAFRRMRSSLPEMGLQAGAAFHVNPRELSVYLGISRSNLQRLRELNGGTVIGILADPSAEFGSMRLDVP